MMSLDAILALVLFAVIVCVFGIVIILVGKKYAPASWQFGIRGVVFVVGALLILMRLARYA